MPFYFHSTYRHSLYTVLTRSVFSAKNTFYTVYKVEGSTYLMGASQNPRKPKNAETFDRRNQAEISVLHFFDFDFPFFCFFPKGSLPFSESCKLVESSRNADLAPSKYLSSPSPTNISFFPCLSLLFCHHVWKKKG